MHFLVTALISLTALMVSALSGTIKARGNYNEEVNYKDKDHKINDHKYDNHKDNWSKWKKPNNKEYCKKHCKNDYKCHSCQGMSDFTQKSKRWSSLFYFNDNYDSKYDNKYDDKDGRKSEKKDYNKDNKKYYDTSCWNAYYY
ncbi:hypothetical protein DFS33DRAFT_1274123 [Desarmillaria ectypa]|nr:hypothetical protein DFS33DRAFT_1427811 [Desarmillaria ectypa]KAK0205174.1 hypothetical protein DFS33DRAFT_1274123 [Desarmillaria ectypa]